MAHSRFDLSGKVAVVIGGTSGIGRAIAEGLAESGADVIASSRRQQQVEDAARAIERNGRRTLRVCCDVMDRGSLKALYEGAIAEFGQIDIVVNAAGKTKRTPTLNISEEEWQDILETNLSGILRACQIFGAHMCERRRGRIINIASLCAFRGCLEVSAYGASKAGVVSLTKSLAVEWAPYGVCVNAIAPGVFVTALNESILQGPRGQELLMRTPMKRFGQLDELAGAAVFLASDAAGFVTGHTLAVDGGFLASGVNQ